MRTWWMGMVLAAAGACAPGPWDWSGGLEGFYTGESTAKIVQTDSITTDRTEINQTSFDTVEILSGDLPTDVYVVMVPCGATPARWSGISLTGEAGYSCRERDIPTVGATSTQEAEIDSLTVTSTAPGAIKVEGEWKITSRTDGTSLERRSQVTYTFEGRRSAQE